MQRRSVSTCHDLVKCPGQQPSSWCHSLTRTQPRSWRLGLLDNLVELDHRVRQPDSRRAKLPMDRHPEYLWRPEHIETQWRCLW
jgi:hypothetical protein